MRLFYSPYLVCTGIIIALTSCSIFERSSSTSLELPLEPRIESEGAPWVKIKENPSVYGRATEPSEPLNTYLTAIKDCGHGKQQSEVTAARQLLVGLKDIQIERREPVTVADYPALFSISRATLDSIPIKVASYTVQQDKCVYDFVLWSRLDDRDGNDETSFDSAATNFSFLMDKILPSVIH